MSEEKNPIVSAISKQGVVPAKPQVSAIPKTDPEVVKKEVKSPFAHKVGQVADSGPVIPKPSATSKPLGKITITVYPDRPYTTVFEGSITGREVSHAIRFIQRGYRDYLQKKLGERPANIQAQPAKDSVSVETTQTPVQEQTGK